MKIRLCALLTCLLPIALQAGDDFGEATAVSFPTAQPALTVNDTTTGATAQPGEPDHNGLPATNSFWYALTVDEARRVEITGSPSGVSNLVLSLYTGESLATLTPVSRYSDLSIPASSQSSDPDGEPFTTSALIHFDAVPETTYFLAVDAGGSSPGAFTLNFATSRNPLNAKLELIPARAEWSFYQALNGTATFDPSTDDLDFYATWHTAADYNGPAFSEPRATPIGYGLIDAEPNRSAGSTLVTPASGSRQAVTYYRTTFTPTRAIQELGFEGLLDDGAIIYLNGEEVARMNVPDTADPNSSTSTATAANFTASSGALNTEAFIQYALASDLALPAGSEVEIAVSSHNTSPTSSDSNFHLRVYATEITEITDVQLELRNTLIEDDYELVWQAQEGFIYRVEFSNTSLDEASWREVFQGTETATRNGPLNRFVRSTGPAGYWRVITIPPSEEN